MKIEKGIPVTDQRRGNHRKYPWDEMEVGDSFFVPGKSPNTISSSANYQSKTRGWRFKVASLEGGVRVWRVA
jgi:hypothetical protein